jgi:hypothetical protein
MVYFAGAINTRKLPMFYTYIHYTADTKTPFYIGKGKGRRKGQTTQRSKWWKSIVAKHGFVSEVLSTFENESDAYEHEKFIILCFKDMGYKLCNMNDGGKGGQSGSKRPSQQKFMLGNKFSLGKNTGRNEKCVRYGKDNGMYGKSAVKGRTWYNNGLVNTYLLPTDEIPEGFNKGRLPFSLKNRRSYAGENNPNYKGKK